MAPLIPAATMAQLRRIDESAMPSTCRLLRRSDVQDSTSGLIDTTTFGPVGGTFSCRMLRGGAADSVIGEKLRGSVVGVVTVPLGVDVKADDRIEVTTTVAGITVTEQFAVTGPDVEADSYSTSYPVPVRIV